MKDKELLDYIQALESIKDLIKPKRFKFKLAEALVHYYSLRTSSRTRILKLTNRELQQRGLGKVSYSFVRHILEK